MKSGASNCSGLQKVNNLTVVAGFMMFCPLDTPQQSELHHENWCIELLWAARGEHLAGGRGHDVLPTRHAPTDSKNEKPTATTG
jgi:hypothetical protein